MSHISQVLTRYPIRSPWNTFSFLFIETGFQTCDSCVGLLNARIAGMYHHLAEYIFSYGPGRQKLKPCCHRDGPSAGSREKTGPGSCSILNLWSLLSLQILCLPTPCRDPVGIQGAPMEDPGQSTMFFPSCICRPFSVHPNVILVVWGTAFLLSTLPCAVPRGCCVGWIPPESSVNPIFGPVKLIE